VQCHTNAPFFDYFLLLYHNFYLFAVFAAIARENSIKLKEIMINKTYLK